MTTACNKCGQVTDNLVVCEECRPNLTSYEVRKYDRVFQRTVVERSGCQCVNCGYSAEWEEGKLCADHLDTKGAEPERRYDLTNAACRCLTCHNKRNNGNIPVLPPSMKKPEPTKKRTKPPICDKLGCPIYASGKGAKKPNRCFKHQ